eukprot:GILK01007964.1.p1 GENE.GILK01007964.1~~GILK01007964.1.p1  ORF type:complete len:1684 (-),score=272.07 GILK01007964.1:169-4602(-)
MEKRSWLHTLHTFHRVVTFFTVALHMLVITAIEDLYGFPLNPAVLSSLVFSVFGMVAWGGMLEMWVTLGQTDGRSSVLWTVARFVIKNFIFGALGLAYYVFFFMMAPTMQPALPFYMPVAAFCGPSIVVFLFSVSSFRFTWGSDYLTECNVPLLQRLKYICLWLLILSCKFSFNYFLQIRPMIEPTIKIYNTTGVVYRWFFPVRDEHNVVAIALQWLPVLLVYFMDVQIAFALGSTIWGGFLGARNNVGCVRSMRMVRENFKELKEQFNKKLLPAEIAPAAPVESPETPAAHLQDIRVEPYQAPLTGPFGQGLAQVREEDNDAMTRELLGGERRVSAGADTPLLPLAAMPAESQQLEKFCEGWNEMIKSMRQNDLVNNKEMELLKFAQVTVNGCSNVLWPVFLSAGKIDYLIDKWAIKVAQYADANTKQRKEMDAEFEGSVTCTEAVAEIYETCMKVLNGLVYDQACLLALSQYIQVTVSAKGLLYLYKPAQVRATKVALAALLETLLQFKRKGVAEGAVDRMAFKLKDCLQAIASCFSNHSDTFDLSITNQLEIIRRIKTLAADIVSQPVEDLKQRVDSLLNLPFIEEAMLRTVHLLTTTKHDATPGTGEGKRRIITFVNSLFMDMPRAKAVAAAASFTILTPYFGEIVMYSKEELQEQNEDGVSKLYYLQTIHKQEWTNFLERIGCRSEEEAIEQKPMEVRLWASYRGQTLARTVRGMMFNEMALRLQAWWDLGLSAVSMHNGGCSCNACVEVQNLVCQKFSYVVTAQVYGQHKKNGDRKAAEIDLLLHWNKNLRVAFIDEVANRDVREYYSVLIKSEDGRVKEVYRVQLPGDPILGEGKPENQNHAIIFTRGEKLQTIDMNQDMYLEEAYKMRNLLEEFAVPSSPPRVVLGIREHVFTGTVSCTAHFMSIQESTFVSLSQRILYDPFRVRMHYGHPDMFDKLFVMTSGGISKSSKGIHLSEDIFSGYNVSLRGGIVSMHEYIQVGKGRDLGMQQVSLFEAKLAQGNAEQTLSRELDRMCRQMDFFRLLSFFSGHIGFYLCTYLTTVAIFCWVYSKLYISLSGLDVAVVDSEQEWDNKQYMANVFNTAWLIQMGFLLSLPAFMVRGIEKGFRKSLQQFVMITLQLSPLFYMFQMGTKSHYLDQTIVSGGAKYRATGRDFVVRHENFAELYRFYCRSHFYKAFELLVMLVLYAWTGAFTYADASGRLQFLDWFGIFFKITLSLWLIVAAWLFAPFIFNPAGFSWSKNLSDYKEWHQWIQNEEDLNQRNSWLAWWRDEISFTEHLPLSSRLLMLLRSCRFFVVSYAFLYHSSFSNAYKYYTAAGILVVFASLLAVIWLSVKTVRHANVYKQNRVRLTKLAVSILLVGAAVGLWLNSNITLDDIFVIVVTLFIFLWGVLFAVIPFNNYRGMAVAQWQWVWRLYNFLDYLVGMLLFLPILILSWFPFISTFQLRLLFNSGFSQGLEVSQLFEGKKQKNA